MNTPVDSPLDTILQNGYKRNWETYIRELTSTRSTKWDLVILTASNTRQRQAYELQLAHRRRSGLLPRGTDFLVLEDPDGRRIGSGGATLAALSAAARAFMYRSQKPVHRRNPFRGRRLLIIHSGGDSKRLPQYSAFGKLFARVPHQLPDGRCSSLFDEFLVSLCGLPPLMSEGALVVSGDVLLLFDHTQLDFSRQGVVGVGMKVEPEVASHHGVFVQSSARDTVRHFLHKPSLESMTEHGAIDARGAVTVDTGIVWFDSDFALNLLSTADITQLDRVPLDSTFARIMEDGITVNFYGDMLMPLALDTAEEHYLHDTSDGPATEPLVEVRRKVWQRLRGVPFSVQGLSPARFIHFGTTAEYHDTLVTGPRRFGGLMWKQHVASWPEPVETDQSSLVMLNSVAGAVRPEPGARAVIEDSCLRTSGTLGDGAVLSHVWAEQVPLDVRPNVVVHQLPVVYQDEEGLRSGFVARVFGLHDNPKQQLDDPGATFLGMPLKGWMDTAGVSREDLWPTTEHDTDCSLWTARLYPVAAEADQSLKLGLWMQDPGNPPSVALQLWRESPRMSLKESYEVAEHQKILERQVDLEDAVRTQQFLDAVQKEAWSRAAGRLLGHDPAQVHRRAGEAAAQMKANWPEVQLIRGYKAVADTLESISPQVPECSEEAETFDEEAFSALARMIRTQVTELSGDSFRPEGFATDRVTVRAAARLDFGGGWSDTPPHCIEKGGTVLNAAITLNDDYPIVVNVRRLDEPVIRMKSADQGVDKTFTQVADILDCTSPADPLALAKLSMVLHGIVPHDADEMAGLDSVLSRLDGGIEIDSSVNIPKGSGLGTSSIYSGALLTAVARLVGRETTIDRIFDYVLCAEQMLTTGGGWQDQVGGLVGGVKVVTSQPGLPQRLEVQPLELAPGFIHEMNQRIVLVYTGVRRLAKNILRTIMGRFMARDPEAVSILKEIQIVSAKMADALRREDLDTLGRLMKYHWSLNKALDAGSTNPAIDALFAVIEPFAVGAKLAGAGGGGFVEVVAKSAEAAAELTRYVAEHYAGSDVAVYPCRVSSEGYVVEVPEDEEDEWV